MLTNVNKGEGGGQSKAKVRRGYFGVTFAFVKMCDVKWNLKK